jgi:hypothetical protein
VREVGDPQALLQPLDPLNDPLEPALADDLVLLVLELLAQRGELTRRHERRERREQDGILPGFARAVHANVKAQAAGKRPALAELGEVTAGPAKDLLGQLASSLMLAPQNRYEFGEPPRLPKAREDMVLLQPLVLLLNERVHHCRRLGEHTRYESRTVSEPPDALLVDQQDAAERPVLAHQVFRR